MEQLTYLLFLKMAHEQHQIGLDRIVPEGYDWPSLFARRRWRLTSLSPDVAGA